MLRECPRERATATQRARARAALVGGVERLVKSNHLLRRVWHFFRKASRGVEVDARANADDARCWRIATLAATRSPPPVAVCGRLDDDGGRRDGVAAAGGTVPRGAAAAASSSSSAHCGACAADAVAQMSIGVVGGSGARAAEGVDA